MRNFDKHFGIFSFFLYSVVDRSTVEQEILKGCDIQCIVTIHCEIQRSLACAADKPLNSISKPRHTISLKLAAWLALG